MNSRRGCAVTTPPAGRDDGIRKKLAASAPEGQHRRNHCEGVDGLADAAGSRLPVRATKSYRKGSSLPGGLEIVVKPRIAASFERQPNPLHDHVMDFGTLFEG